MNAFGYIAIYCCIPFVLSCFCLFELRKAVLISFLGAWLFLPVAGIPLPGLPGFLLGVALGPIVAHLYLLLQLPTQSREVFVQGLRFTVGSLLYASFALGFLTWTARSAGTTFGMVSVGTLALAPPLAAGCVIWQRVRSSKSSLRASVGVAPAAIGSL